MNLIAAPATVCIFSLSLFFGVVDAGSYGATADSCQSMLPVHGNAVGQNISTSPYIITVADKLRHEGYVHVTLTSASLTPFKGYMIYAQMAGMGDMYHAVGTFTSAGTNGTLVDCGGGVATAASHGFNNDKLSVTVDWIPNGYQGNVIFKVTFLKDLETFWVKQESDIVTAPTEEPSGTNRPVVSSWITAGVVIITLSYYKL